MRYFDIPDLPLRAFVRHGRNIQPQGKSDSPPAPDYAAAAKETAAGNLEAAKVATNANRANQYTPYGNLEWTNNKSFDQTGYDAAMASYQGQAQQVQQAQGPKSKGGYVTVYDGGENDQDFGHSVWMPGSDGAGPGGMPIQHNQNNQGAMPNRNDFYGDDRWSQTITLSPEQQALFDQQNQLQTGLFGAQDQALGRVNQTMGQGFDMSRVPQSGTALDINGMPGYGSVLNTGSLPGAGSVYDPTQSTNTATDAILSRINPQLERDEASLRSQLANQGISQGSTAWNNAMDEMRRGKTDAYTQAGLQGIGLGMQQQGQTFGQQTTNRGMEAQLQGQQFGQQTTNQQLAAALQNQQFGQQQGLRGQGMTEQSYLRSLPLNELNALRTGNQVSQPQFPGYGMQATTGGPDMLGAAQGQYNAALGASNASNAASGGMMSGLFGIAGTALGGPLGGMLGSAIGGAVGK